MPRAGELIASEAQHLDGLRRRPERIGDRRPVVEREDGDDLPVHGRHQRGADGGKAGVEQGDSLDRGHVGFACGADRDLPSGHLRFCGHRGAIPDNGLFGHSQFSESGLRVA